MEPFECQDSLPLIDKSEKALRDDLKTNLRRIMKKLK